MPQPSFSLSQVKDLPTLCVAARAVPQRKESYDLPSLALDDQTIPARHQLPLLAEHQTHTAAQLEAFTKKLPRALAEMGPQTWRVPRLLDSVTGVIRRPKIEVSVLIGKKDRFWLLWDLVPTVPFDASCRDSNARLVSSDFVSMPQTGYYQGDPWNSLITLTERAYPAVPSHRGSAHAHTPTGFTRQLDRARREPFERFVISMVESLQSMFCVYVRDWFTYDEHGYPCTLSFARRVADLAQVQLEEAQSASAAATLLLNEELSRAGITRDILEAALGRQECGDSPHEAFKALTGRRVHHFSARTCTRALESVRAATDVEMRCQQILLEAQEAI